MIVISGKCMNVKRALLLLAAVSTLSVAADMTPQEKEVIAGIRQMYAQQMGRQPTAEEEQKMLDRWRAVSMRMAVGAAQINRMGQGGMVPAVTATQAAPVAAAMSEEALAQKLAAQGPAKAGLTMEHVRDGLKIGGTTFLDPEGQIKSFAYDVLSGDLSYTIRSGDSLIYKYLRAGSAAEPVAFASARQSGDGWQVNTVTGKILNGNTVIPLAKGLMVARSGSVFLYEAGKGNQSAAVPDGWVMAPFQRGNVGATHYVMLERASSEVRGTAGGLFGSLKSLGAVVGVNKKEDYALMHLDTGKLHLLNVQSSGKNQAVMSNCRKRNAVVNECATMNTFESLYTDIGRNFGHYFWKADWYATPSGPIAVTMENGVADIYVLDLQSGKKVSVFHRGLGITSVDTVQGPDGKVAIKANWMFEDHKVDDAGKFLYENAAIADAQASVKP